jgi:hypothetical protein
VRSHREAVRAVAAALLDEGALDADEIDELVCGGLMLTARLARGRPLARFERKPGMRAEVWIAWFMGLQRVPH